MSTLKNLMPKLIPTPHFQFVSFVEIRGTDRSDARELHIAYRYGEHYDSVRRINDDSEAPAYLQMEVGCDGMSQLWVTNRSDECCQLISVLIWDGGRSWISVSCWDSKALVSRAAGPPGRGWEGFQPRLEMNPKLML